MKILDEFKTFAIQGNMIDLAVGVIIGTAFSRIVDSLVMDVIMPVVAVFTGGLDFSNRFIPLAGQQAATLEEARQAGAVLAYGSFITAVLNFLILAFIVFLMVKAINRMRAKAARESEPQGDAAPEDILLLREIRDSLKRATGT